ncbi:Dihydropteroate synthase [Candidatus Methylacidithermus pantelleriae]|uniref:Dihydropteroate synthase n=2 Tax=Candidatus Methylacidithermus pantelleriae TaxID=2744239 RepID=A0A8J2BKS4_9BACT|nr:Dihydropteroate synthase [Candidatus Methylacidithermus pantelleriae]
MLSLPELSALWETYKEDWQCPVQEFSLGPHVFTQQGAPYIMGVINLSPDSWYRESVVLNTEAAIERGKLLTLSGASIVDLGAESSLLHARRASIEEQKQAFLPIVRELAEQNVLVSVETYYADVALAGLKAGARIINLTGPRESRKIYAMVGAFDAAVIINYVEGPNVREVGEIRLVADPIAPLYEYFAREIELASKAGVKRIWVDPGLGFYYSNLQDSAERVRRQMEIFLGTFRLRRLGWPTCHALPHAFEYFEEEVRVAEPFFAVLAILGKTDLLRTHEVRKVRGVVRSLQIYHPKLAR